MVRDDLIENLIDMHLLIIEQNHDKYAPKVVQNYLRDLIAHFPENSRIKMLFMKLAFDRMSMVERSFNFKSQISTKNANFEQESELYLTWLNYESKRMKGSLNLNERLTFIIKDWWSKVSNPIKFY